MCRDKWFTAEQEEMAQMGQPGGKARNCNLRPSDRVRMTAGGATQPQTRLAGPMTSTK